jgi:hypothetical protein
MLRPAVIWSGAMPSTTVSLNSSLSTQVTVEPFGVRPKRACQLMSIGKTKLYGLIDACEVDSYLDDGVRIITVESIKRRQARLLAGPAAKKQTPQRSTSNKI